MDPHIFKKYSSPSETKKAQLHNRATHKKWEKTHDTCWTCTYISEKGAPEARKMQTFADGKVMNLIAYISKKWPKGRKKASFCPKNEWKLMSLDGCTNIFQKKVPRTMQKCKILKEKWKKAHEFWWNFTYFLKHVPSRKQKCKLLHEKWKKPHESWYVFPCSMTFPSFLGKILHFSCLQGTFLRNICTHPLRVKSFPPFSFKILPFWSRWSTLC